MKKFLIVILLCLISFSILANQRPIGRRIVSKNLCKF